MREITNDLQDLQELYFTLERRLERQYQELLAHQFPNPDEAQEATDLECRILEAEKHLVNLTSNGGINSLNSPGQPGANTSCAGSLRKHAQHLLELLGRNAAQCQQLRSAAQVGLRELGRGAEFLQSVRGCRENQPKFLDSSQ